MSKQFLGSWLLALSRPFTYSKLEYVFEQKQSEFEEAWVNGTNITVQRIRTWKTLNLVNDIFFILFEKLQEDEGCFDIILMIFIYRAAENSTAHFELHLIFSFLSWGVFKKYLSHNHNTDKDFAGEYFLWNYKSESVNFGISVVVMSEKFKM